MEFKTFDIVFARFRTQFDSHVQSKTRPCVVIQNDDGNYYAPTLNVIPLTHVIKKTGQSTHGVIKKSKLTGLLCDSMILGEQIFTIDKRDVVKKLGSVKEEEEQAIVSACFLAIHFGRKKVKVEVM